MLRTRLLGWAHAALLKAFRARGRLARLSDANILDEADRREIGFGADDEYGPERIVDEAALADARRTLNGGDIPECLYQLSRALTGGDNAIEFYEFHGLADTVERYYRRKFDALSR